MGKLNSMKRHDQLSRDLLGLGLACHKRNRRRGNGSKGDFVDDLWFGNGTGTACVFRYKTRIASRPCMTACLYSKAHVH